MDFETMRQDVKREVPCINYLHKARNGGYICPYCGSGTGKKGTGAVVYYPETNTFYCHKCERSGDCIDAYLLDTGRDPKDGKAHRQGVIELGQTIGEYPDDEKDSRPRTEWTQKDREGLQRMKERREEEKEADPGDEYGDIDFSWDDDEPAEENAPENDLNGHTADLSTQGDNSTPEPVKAVENESGAPESKTENTPELFKADCEKWAASIGKTDYLTRQGITPEIQKRFHVGYIPESNEVVFPYNGAYSYYEKRKAQKDYDGPYRKPKAEIAGPEPLYNPAALYTGKPCFICEGVIDVLSITQAGGNACATCGAGYKGLRKQIEKRKPGAPVILWFDCDLPGKDGKCQGAEECRKAAQVLQENGVEYIEARYNLDLYGLKEGDPNDLLKANPAQFEADVKENIARAEALEGLGPDMGPFLQTILTERYKPIPTGINGLDSFLHGGLIRQTLVLLSSKPGAGKTILASMILESMARRGIPCVYLNLEMSKEQLLARSLSRMLYLDFNRKLTAINILQAYSLTSEDKKLLVQAARKYADEIGPNMTYNPLETSDLDTILDYLEKTAETAEAAGKPAPCACIDYLHIITSTTEKDPREIIKRAVQGLKEYASKHNAIVIAIEAESRQASKSKAADIAAARDSSSAEYSGDLILQLKTGEDTDPAKGDPDTISLYVTKSRFTDFNSNSGLMFKKHGGQSYFEQVGEWTNTPLCDRTPFDDDGDAGEIVHLDF